jgi:hypothetical protein
MSEAVAWREPTYREVIVDGWFERRPWEPRSTGGFSIASNLLFVGFLFVLPKLTTLDAPTIWWTWGLILLAHVGSMGRDQVQLGRGWRRAAAAMAGAAGKWLATIVAILAVSHVVGQPEDSSLYRAIQDIFPGRSFAPSYTSLMLFFTGMGVIVVVVYFLTRDRTRRDEEARSAAIERERAARLAATGSPVA